MFFLIYQPCITVEFASWMNSNRRTVNSMYVSLYKQHQCYLEISPWSAQLDEGNISSQTVLAKALPNDWKRLITDGSQTLTSSVRDLYDSIQHTKSIVESLDKSLLQPTVPGWHKPWAMHRYTSSNTPTNSECRTIYLNSTVTWWTFCLCKLQTILLVYLRYMHTHISVYPRTLYA
jgi:hypothetical protein